MPRSSENVISIKTGMPKPEPLRISEYSLTVADEIYHVRRAVDAKSLNGILTIKDDEGRAVLVRGASIPDEFVFDLIQAWLAGRGRGRVEGRNSLRADLACLLKTEL